MSFKIYGKIIISQEAQKEIFFFFGLKPYATAISRIQIVDHSNPRSFLIPGRTPKYEPLLYCGFCNQYANYHEHECNDDPPWDPYDSYPFDAPDTD